MTINIQKAGTVNVTGHHIRGNSKPVFCITDGSVYASVTDVAENFGVHMTAVSQVLNGKVRTCKGKRYCFISEVMAHLNEIAENFQIRNAKIEAYDAMIAEQNAKKEAQENLAKHKAKCEELRQKLENEIRLLEEAQAIVDEEDECQNIA